MAANVVRWGTRSVEHRREPGRVWCFADDGARPSATTGMAHERRYSLAAGRNLVAGLRTCVTMVRTRCWRRSGSCGSTSVPSGRPRLCWQRLPRFKRPSVSRWFRSTVQWRLSGDTGTAARIFYTAKAGPDERLDPRHPTVKPVALMEWLVRLVTPPGGTVLDPFCGTGSTLVACDRLGFDAIGIEQERRLVPMPRRRSRGCGAAPAGRRSWS